MNNNLIEQLKKYMSSRGFPAQHESEIIAMVEAALSPVLPEEVQFAARHLADTDAPILADERQQYADLIERLWLENRLTKSQLLEAQARIEELPECNTELMQEIKWQDAAELDNCKEQIAEYEKALEDAAVGNSYAGCEAKYFATQILERIRGLK